MKKYRLSYLTAIAAACVLLTVGCATVDSKPAEDFDAVVDAVYTLYVAANLEEDAESYVALWDESIGKESLRAKKRAFFEQWNYLNQQVLLEEVRADGEWGFVRGTSVTLLVSEADGTRYGLEAEFLAILKRQPDGTWRLYSDSVTNARWSTPEAADSAPESGRAITM